MSSQQHSVLVVSHRGPIRRGFASLLSKTGCDAAGIDGVRPALLRLQETRLDCVLIDAEMPESGAFVLLAQLASAGTIGQIEVVLMHRDPMAPLAKRTAKHFGVTLVETFADRVQEAVLSALYLRKRQSPTKTQHRAAPSRADGVVLHALA